MDDPSPTRGTIVPARTEDRLSLLADLTVEVLIARAKAGTITAAELTVATNYLKTAGVKPVVSNAKVDDLVKSLPTFDLLDEIIGGQGQMTE